MGGMVWRPEDIQFLRDNALNMRGADIASHLGRNLGSVYRKASFLGISLGKPGAKARICEHDRSLCLALRNEGLNYKDIAEKMEFSVSTVWKFCNPSATPKSTSHDAWLSRELRKCGMKYDEIAEKMELSTTTVWKMCNFKGKYSNAHQG